MLFLTGGHIGHCFLGFRMRKFVFRIYYTSKNLFCHLYDHWEARKGGCRHVALDEVSFFGSLTRIWCSASLAVWGAFSRGFGSTNLYSRAITIIKTYYTPYFSFGRWQRVDAGMQLWMTLPFWPGEASYYLIYYHILSFKLKDFFEAKVLVYLYLFYLFLCIRGGRNGWMALKQLSCLSYLR